MAGEDVFDFAAFRAKLGVNQKEMADMLGISARTYFTLEAEPEKAPAIYVANAELLSIEEAIARKDVGIAAPRVAEIAVAFARMARGRKVRWI
jgi:DNA-binding XRE family transcriptional regulator